GGTAVRLRPGAECDPAPPDASPGQPGGALGVVFAPTPRPAGRRDGAGTEGGAGAPPVREPRLFYGAGGMQPVPPVSQWQAGFSGPPITWAVVSTTTRPAVISLWRESRNAPSLGGLIE